MIAAAPVPLPTSPSIAVSSCQARQREEARTLRLPLYHPDDEKYLTELVCLVRRQLEVFVVPTPETKGNDDAHRKKSESAGGKGKSERAALGEKDPPLADGCAIGAAGEGSVAAKGLKVGIRCVHCAPPDGVLDVDVPCGAKRGRRRKNPPPTALDGLAGDGGNGGGKGGHRRTKGAITHPTTVRLVYQGIRNWQRHHLMTCPDIPPDVKEAFQALKMAALQKRSSAGLESAKYWEVGCARMGLIDTPCGLRLRKFVLDGTWTEEMGREAAEKAAARVGLAWRAKSEGKADMAEPKITDQGWSLDYNSEVERPEIKPFAVASAKITSVTTPTIAPQPGLKRQSTDGSCHDPSGIGVFVGVNNSLETSTAHSESAMAMALSDGIKISSNPISADSCIQSSNGCAIETGDNTSPLPAGISTVGIVHARSTPLAGHLSNTYLPPSKTSSPSQAEITSLPVEYRPGATPHAGNYQDHTASVSQTAAPAALSEQGDCKSITEVASMTCPEPSLSLSDHPTAPIIPATERSTVSGEQKFEDHSITPVTSLSPRSKDELLERVQLARRIVHTIGEMRKLPPSSNEKQEQNLSDLGLELYALFTGQNEIKDDSEEKCSASPADEVSLQSRKKGKRSEKRGYALLRNLGLPTSLCNMVSSLQSGDDNYESIDQVAEDLRLMETQPEKFLFNSPNGDLQISPHTLYGRTSEASKLLEVYKCSTDSDSEANNMVLISGYAGTGKSSLVQSVQKQLVDRGAKFTTGKFDAMMQAQPLSAVVSAMDDYCNLLARDTDRINQVQKDVTNALGSECLVLAKLLPNLHKVTNICEGPTSVQVSGREALQRLVLLFRLLLRSTCAPYCPCVLFLDDLQWADEVSLELIHALVTDSEIRGLFVIGCFRTVSPCHPLAKHLDGIQKSDNVNVTSMFLDNLDADAVNDMLSDNLHMLPRRTRKLSEAVLHKTGGNALFVVRFLSSLHQEGLFRFSLASKEWEWDIERINQKGIADNVVELMRAKILRLAPDVREALQVAASFGAQCQADVLHIIDKATDSAASTPDALDVAVSEGLMAKEKSAYKFSHDQIQRAAYLLIPDSERDAFHLRNGRLLLKCSTEEIERNLFIVVDQMQRGSSLITDRCEKINFARLCLMAGMKASIMSAFLPASVYLKAGIGLLRNDDWDFHRELCVELYNSCAETECILGDFDAMRAHVEEVLARGSTPGEKMRGYYILVKSMSALGNVPKAIDVAMTVLTTLGESIPTSVTLAEIQQEIEVTRQMLRPYTKDSILKLEPMHDSNKMEAMRFLNVISSKLYYIRKHLFPLVVCRMVKLSLSHGVCKESAFGFALFGLVLSGSLGDLYAGYEYGKVALALNNKVQAREYHCSTHCMVHGFLNVWIEPIQSVLEALKNANNSGLLTGDTEYAWISAQQYVSLALVSGTNLGDLMDEMTAYSKQMKECKQMVLYTLNAPFRQAALNLLGRSADPVKLVGGEMENAMKEQMENGDIYLRALVCALQVWLEYLFGHYDLAAGTANSNQDVESIHASRFAVVCTYAFYSGLAAIAMARTEGKEKWDNEIKRTMEKMKFWASSSRWNCQHKLELMEAEYAFLERDVPSAAEKYESAIANAKNHRFVHEQALALERAGIFYLENGNDAIASNFFEKAYTCYSKWGASSKAWHSQQTYL